MNKKRFLRILLRAGRDFLILIFMGNIIGFILMGGKDFSMHLILQNSLYAVIIGYITWKGIEFIVRYLDKQVPWLKNPIKRLILQLGSTVFYCVIVFGIFSIVIFNVIQKVPIQEFQAHWIKSIEIALGVLIVGSGLANSVLFFNNWKKAAVQQEKLKLEHLSLQYETLKNQVNPHFLFNSFNSLTSLIENDKENAIRFVKKLSEVYRYVLDQRDRELVSLQEEIDFVRSYVFLQQIRFQDKLKVKIEIEDYRDKRVIPLSFQMLVENAIKHNVISTEQPLEIKITENEGYFIIINNLQKKESLEGTTGMGIENLMRRYEYFTGKPVQISDDGKNYIVSVPVLIDDRDNF